MLYPHWTHQLSLHSDKRFQLAVSIKPALAWPKLCLSLGSDIKKKLKKNSGLMLVTDSVGNLLAEHDYSNSTHCFLQDAVNRKAFRDYCKFA